MPTYEYMCVNCDYRFEEFQSMSDSPLTECPKCGGAVKRLIGGGNGLIFKGSGFYITDYKNKKSSVSTPKNESKEKSTKKNKII